MLNLSTCSKFDNLCPVIEDREHIKAVEQMMVTIALLEDEHVTVAHHTLSNYVTDR